jgi:hypothetical protein
LLHLEEVFMHYKMILTHILIIKKFLFYLVIHLFNTLISTIFLLNYLLNLRFHLHNLLLIHWIFILFYPFYCILVGLMNIFNSLEDTCDVIDSPLKTFRTSTASFKSRVISLLLLIRSINFFVKKARLLSWPIR